MFMVVGKCQQCILPDINTKQDIESGSFKSERESATATEKVYYVEVGGAHGCLFG
jgi:hypothetical protein